MEDLDHSFQPSTIQRMELMLLQMLGWRLGPITAYSYVELLTCNGDFLTSHLHEQFITKVNDWLLHSLMGIASGLFKFIAPRWPKQREKNHTLRIS